MCCSFECKIASVRDIHTHIDSIQMGVYSCCNRDNVPSTLVVVLTKVMDLKLLFLGSSFNVARLSKTIGGRG